MAMAGIGEVSAIIGLISTAARLSKAIIEIGSSYKDARAQIESFGRDLAILGRILDQLKRLVERDSSSINIGAHLLITEIVDECSDMLFQLDSFNDKLYGKSSSLKPSLRGKTKWVFEAAELNYLRARVDSMKINLLLMMTFQAINGQQSMNGTSRIAEHANDVRMLSSESDACIQRLQTLESEMAPVSEYEDEEGTGASIMTFETAHSTRSTRDSILGVYDQSPYRELWSSSDTSSVTAYEKYDGESRVSDLVEDYLSQASVSPRRGAITNENNEDHDSIIGSLGDAHTQSVLSLDGGGVRTYSTLLILRQLMEDIAYIESAFAIGDYEVNPPPLYNSESLGPSVNARSASVNYYPCQYFSYIAGASTGGLIAIMLGRLGMPIQECLNEFRSVLETMYGCPRSSLIRNSLNWRQPKFDHRVMESNFKGLIRRNDMRFEERLQMGFFASDPIQCKTIAVSWLRSSAGESGKPFLFRSYDQKPMSEANRPLRGPTGKLLTWQIARALIASPSYFAPMKIEEYEFSGDDKLLHNPSFAVFKEVIERSDTSPNTQTFFISIGSGNAGRANMGNVLASSPQEATILRDMTYPRSKNKYTYHRLNPGHKLEAVKIDEWEKNKQSGEITTLERITRASESYLSSPLVKESLRQIAKTLVMRRRTRSEQRNFMRSVHVH